ncbi:Diacylglycerol kinase [Gammaproteobacteria bacterium]
MNSTIKKLMANLRHSLRGLLLGLAEHSFIIELLLGIFIVIILLADREVFIKAIVLTVYFLLLVVELLNTAIEKICNRITTVHDKNIRDIKDISSAAVFLLVLLNFMVIISCFLQLI